MTWGEADLNDPKLYAPRERPVVLKATTLAAPTWEDGAQTLPEIEYISDEPYRWDVEIGEVPLQLPPARRAPAGRRNAYVRDLQEKKPPRQTKKRSHARSADGGGRRGGHPLLYASIITACLFMLAALGVVMMPQLAGYFWADLGNYAFINGEVLRYDPKIVQTYKTYRAYLQDDSIIYPGVYVDGVHVGGMTEEQARAALTSVGANAANAFSVTVSIGDRSWTLDNSNITATRDLGNLLQRAYTVGRTNSAGIVNTLQTPFHERASAVIALRDQGLQLASDATYNHDEVRAIVEKIATEITREPQDSQIASFDFKTRTFTFTDDQVGVTIDREALYQKLIESLDRWERGVTLTVAPVLTTASVTKEMLSSQFRMISAFTTSTTRDANRTNNIDLACQAINGTALMPGETFSFNQTTGQRTIAKGYKEAGAIAAGQSIDEVGGGICQASSTLFNAVARANLKIVERSPHAWPSSYVHSGEDATVNWPNLDFRFKNDTNMPIFVIMYYKERKVSAEIWGMSLGSGVTIDLKSEVVRTMSPPDEANYVYNPELPVGESKETIKARTGYVVDTYQVWYLNGVETKREKLHTSTYKAYQRTIEYN